MKGSRSTNVNAGRSINVDNEGSKAR
jgi:hypothetical protein